MALPPYLSDIGTYLQTAGIGTLGTNIHYRSFDNDALVDIALIPAGGSGNNNITNIDDIVYSPRLTVNVRNTDAVTCETTANSIYNLLNFITNKNIGSTRVVRIEAEAPPFFVAKDTAQCYIYSINFSLQIQ